jgi:hypothetical protein
MEDAEKAKGLKRRIESFGLTCWIDAIFAFSSSSRESRWMPWELGFFDGRWGSRLIGLYDLDEGASENSTQSVQSKQEVGIPEFLQIYTELTPKTLEGLLQHVRSPRALSDRADVDIDRWANLVAGIMRDPVNVSIDAMQFWISYQQVFWGSAPWASDLDFSQPLIGFIEATRTAMAPLGRMMQPALPGVFDGLVQQRAAASAEAQQMSR